MSTSRPVSYQQAVKRYGLVRADQLFPDDSPPARTRKRTAVTRVNRVISRPAASQR